MAEFWSVPRDWPGDTCVVMAGGPSLAAARVDLVREAHARGACRAVAVSDAYRLAPWADVLYSADAKWWNWHWAEGAGKFAGVKVTVDQGLPYGDLKVLRIDTGGLAHVSGYDPRPTHLTDGCNSGHQAVHIAAHYGASRILLLGFDMTPGHFFGEHPAPLNVDSPYPMFIREFAQLALDLAKRKVRVINCTPGSALPWFPRADLADALAGKNPGTLTPEDLLAMEDMLCMRA